MKYYLIAGEASGDLHASRLMQALKAADSEAEFRFFGGDMMAAVGGTMVKHYKELAYMGFVPVLLHLPTILSNMKMCKHDILEWNPDAVILIDYPGFNLKIAKFVHSERVRRKGIPSLDSQIYYYISPKIWAWKEYRIKNIKRDVDELFSILPFEVPFFEGKHHYPIHYVGNPTEEEVREFLGERSSRGVENRKSRGIIALLAGSRRQEIKDNLPAMIEATRDMTDYDVVIAGAPSIPHDYYDRFVSGTHVKIVYERTYHLLAEATAALVTSGKATLETALFDVPQVVCYETPLPRLIGYLRKRVLSVKFISLVNLIADREVVRELVADSFNVENIRKELLAILPGGEGREQMLLDYQDVHKRLGQKTAPATAARIMTELLKKRKSI